MAGGHLGKKYHLKRQSGDWFWGSYDVNGIKVKHHPYETPQESSQWPNVTVVWGCFGFCIVWWLD